MRRVMCRPTHSAQAYELLFNGRAVADHLGLARPPATRTALAIVGLRRPGGSQTATSSVALPGKARDSLRAVPPAPIH